jgi:hypothetical protein
VDRSKMQKFLMAAIEASVYLAPSTPGLTRDELIEVGGRVELQPGEILDVIAPLVYAPNNNGFLQLLPIHRMSWGIFEIPQNPDFRNFKAFDFVFSQLIAVARANGAANARLDRSVIVERAVMAGILKTDVEAALVVLEGAEHIKHESGLIILGRGRETSALPSTLCDRHPGSRRDEDRVRAYEIVKDVIGRRSDGRPKHPEPLRAFADELEKLGYAPFKLWWNQIVSKLRRSDTQSSSVSVTVLSAALVEGVLTFIVRHARKLGLGVMGSKNFEGDQRTWKIDDLVSSAAAGRETAILDEPSRILTTKLIANRQRIHAGRMLSEFPGGPTDLRPEEAREAIAVAEMVVRRVLDWLQKYPAT